MTTIMRHLLLAVMFVLPLTLLHSQPRSAWIPQSWNPCEAIVADFGTSTTELMSALHRNGVIGVQRIGNLADGTLSISFNDPLRRAMVQLTIDDEDRFYGAATWETVNSVEDAHSFIGTTVERLVRNGAVVVSGKPTDTSVSLQQICNGGTTEVTIGIQDGDVPQVFIVANALGLDEPESSSFNSDPDTARVSK